MPGKKLEAPESLERTGLVVLNLLGQIAFGMLLMSLCLPSMQSWSAYFGEPQSRVQLTFGAYVVAFGLTQLV